MPVSVTKNVQHTILQQPAHKPIFSVLMTRCKHRFTRACARLIGAYGHAAFGTFAAALSLVLGLSAVHPILAQAQARVVFQNANDGGAIQVSTPVLNSNVQPRHLPAAPANLVAYSDMNAPGRVWLAWHSPPHPVGAPAITHHEYRYKQSGSDRYWEDWTEIPFSAAGYLSGQLHTNQFTVTGLTNGLPYEFQVRAVNHDGAGPPSGVAGAEAGAHFGICGRTRVLRDALVQKVSRADDCAGVMETDLAGIRGGLAIRNAPVTLLPGDLAGLTSLDTLDLDGNPLGGLPPGIFDDMRSLTRLILSNNRLSGLPPGVFDELSALQVLNLDGNQLSGLPAGVVNRLSALEELRLEGNNLGASGLPADVFAGLTALRRLDLSSNQLSGLPPGVFDGLPALEELRLGGNSLAELPARLFAGLPALQILDLRANRLSALPDGIFSGLTNLRALYLEGNSADPMVLAVSLELDEQDRVRALAPAGAPFDIVLTLSVANGSLEGGADTLTIPTGATGSAPLQVNPDVRSLDTTVAIVALPSLPGGHTGCRLERAADQTLVIPWEGNATGAPVISGTARVGRTLAAGTGGILDADGRTRAENGAAGFAYSYRWIRVDIDGVSNPAGVGSDRDSYTLAAADAGSRIRVQVSYTDDAGNAEALISAAYPRNGTIRTAGNATGAPAISGTARVGQTLAADTDGILDADGKAMAESGAAGFAYSYRWVRVDSDGVSNPTGVGSDRDSYVLTAADAGRRIKLQVSYTDDAGNAELLTSAAYPSSGAIRADGNASSNTVSATGTINNGSPAPRGWLARFGRSGAVQVAELLDARFDEAGAATSELVLGGRRVRLPGWQAGRWSLWGRGALTQFGGRDGEVGIDGNVLTGLMGLDYAADRWLAGMALSWSDGDGRYRSDVDSGTVDSHLAGVYPYGRYALNDNLSVWGVAGYGLGEMRLQQTRGGEPAGEALKAGINLGMGATGIKGIVYASEATELAVKSDFLFVRTSSEAVEGMAGVDAADASRLRLLLSGRHRRALANDALLTPDFELGLRYDGGDAETGFGLELGGGLRYADPRLGLTLETRARGLLTHEDGGYQEWGLSGSVQVDPGRAGRGLMLRLASGWGRTASGTQALWDSQGVRGLAPQQGGAPGGRFSAEWSYGLELPWQRGLLTPYGGVEMAGRSRRLRLGWRYEVAQWLTLSLDGERRETPLARPQHGLTLRAALPW